MTGARYAANTQVPWRRSRDELERTLTRWGAHAFAYGHDNQAFTILFALGTGNRLRRIRFRLPIPNRAEYALTARGKARSDTATEAAFDQAVRQAWRALVLIVKAKLAAIDAGVSTIDDEFLAFTLLPNGATFGEWAGPQLDAITARGEMPALLPGGSR
jgi:hypothetical protein